MLKKIIFSLICTLSLGFAVAVKIDSNISKSFSQNRDYTKGESELVDKPETITNEQLKKILNLNQGRIQ